MKKMDAAYLLPPYRPTLAVSIAGEIGAFARVCLRESSARGVFTFADCIMGLIGPDLLHIGVFPLELGINEVSAAISMRM